MLVHKRYLEYIEMAAQDDAISCEGAYSLVVKFRSPKPTSQVRVLVGPQRRNNRESGFSLCGRRSDVLPAGKTASRGRRILRVTTSKISVTAKDKCESVPKPRFCGDKILSRGREMYSWSWWAQANACDGKCLAEGEIPGEHARDACVQNLKTLHTGTIDIFQ